MDGANFYSGNYDGSGFLSSLKTIGSVGLKVAEKSAKAAEYAVDNADKIQSLANTAGQVTTVFKGVQKPQVAVSEIPTNNNSNESIPAQQTTTTGAGMSNAYEQFVGAKESQLIGGSAVGAAGAGDNVFDNVGDYTLADKATLEQLKRYENSGSMRAKRLLLKSLGRALSREFGWGKEFETTDDATKLSKMIRDKIPTVAEGKFPESSKAQEQALRKMANVINEVYGTRVINSQGDLQNLAPEVGEFVYSLATGLHTEFMVVQENVKTVMTNIVMLRAALKTAYNEIKARINQANSDPMALADEVRPYDELYVRLEEELDRQHLMLQNLLSVTIEVGDRQLKQMLLEAADMHERVMNLDERRGPAGSDALPGGNFYATTLAHILNTFANISLLAAQTDRALSKLGMTVSEYANTSSIKELKSKIDKLYKQKLPGMKYNEAQTFLDSADIVTKSFGNHKKVAEAIKKMDKSVSGGDHDRDGAPDNVRNDDERDAEPSAEYAGGATRGGAVTRAYKSVLQRRLEQERRIRKLIFKQFSNEFARYIQAITTGISEFAVRVGRDLPSPPELNAFRDAVNKMTDIRLKEVYVALIGFNVSARAKHIRDKYQDRIRNLGQATARLMAAPGMSGAAAVLRDIKSLCDDVNQHIDRHSDMIATKYAKYSQKYIGMGEEEEEPVTNDSSTDVPSGDNVAGGVDFDGVIVGGSEVNDALLDALDVPGETVSMVNNASVDSYGDAILNPDVDLLTTLEGNPDAGLAGAAEGDAAGAAGGDVIRPFLQPRPEDLSSQEAEFGTVPVIENVVASLKGANSLLTYNTYLTSFADNFKHTAKAIGEIEKQAEDVLAIAIAKKKHAIRAERDTTLKALVETEPFKNYVNKPNPSDTTESKKHQQRNQMYDNIADNLKGMYNTREDFYTLVEGMDTYLRTFTKDLAANAEKVREIKKVLDNHQVISRWFDESSGESLGDLFEFFPYSHGEYGFAADNTYESYNVNAANEIVPDDFIRLKLAEQNKDVHYYKRVMDAFQAGTAGSQNASGKTPVVAYAMGGNPYFLLDPILGPELMKKVKNSTHNLHVLKNIVSAFSRIGDNITTGSNLFINDAQIYDGLLKYLHFSSISFGLVSEYDLNDNTGNNSAEIYIDLRTCESETKLARVPVIQSQNNLVGGGPRASNGKIYTGTGINPGLNNNNVASIRKRFRVRYGPHMSSVYDGVGSNYKDEDELWVMIIKAMVAKILTVLGVSQMLNRPSGKLPGFNTVRQVLGGADGSTINDYAQSPNIEEGALKLYFYLPRLLMFYRDLFDPEADMDVADWGRPAPNGTIHKRISMTPDIEGTFSGLIWLFFTQLDYNTDGNFSDAETRRIISEINQVYAKYRGQRDPTRAVIDDLVSEVNRRYGVITHEDQQLYQNYKNTLQSSDFSDPPNGRTRDYEVLKNEGTEEATIVPPSSKYTLGDLGMNSEPTTILDSRSPYEINKRNLLLITRFRESLSKALTINNTSRGGDNDRQWWINSPYKKMLETCNTDFKRAGSEPQRFTLASSLVRANNVVDGQEYPRFVMIHETIVAGLTSLNAVYAQLCAFRERIAEINFIAHYAGNVPGPNKPNANAMLDRHYIPTRQYRHMRFANYADGNVNGNIAVLMTNDRVDVMHDLLENVMCFAADLQDYVTVRFEKNGTVFINYAGLYDEIRNMMASVRYYSEFFRKYTTEAVLKNYLDPDTRGSLYWLEQNLVEGMFVKKSNISLAALTNSISSMFKQLVEVPNSNYERVFRRILYYDADVNDSEVPGPARLTEGISPYDKIMSGAKAHRSFRFDKLYSFAGGLKEDVKKSLLFGMNEAFAKYVSTAYDPVSQKACDDMLRVPAEDVFPRAVSDMASYPDTHVALFGHIRWLAQSARYGPAGGAARDTENEQMNRLKMILNEAGFIYVPAAGNHRYVNDLTTAEVRSVQFMQHFSEDKLLNVWESMYGNRNTLESDLIDNLLDTANGRGPSAGNNPPTAWSDGTANGLRDKHNLLFNAQNNQVEDARKAFDRIVTVLKKYAPADPAHSLPPFGAAANLTFKKRAEPDQNAILFTSLAGALKTMRTERVHDAEGNPTDKLKYLVDSYVEMSEAHKETMLAHLPLHAKTFDLLRRKAEVILSVLGVEKLAANLKARNPNTIDHFPQKDINPGMLTQFKNNVSTGDYFVQLTHTMREACARLAGWTTNLYDRMGDKPVFGETRRNEFEDYRKAYNTEPIVPISALTYVFANHGYVKIDTMSGDSGYVCTEHDFLPTSRRDDMKFRYIFSTRHLLGNSRAALKAEHIGQSLKMLDQFPDMDKDRFMRHCGHLVNLTRFVHDMRHFRAQYVSLDRIVPNPMAAGVINQTTVCGRIKLVDNHPCGNIRTPFAQPPANPNATIQLGTPTINMHFGQYNRVDKVLLFTSSHDREKKYKEIAGVVGSSQMPLSTNLKDINIYTIIDLNIIPLNIHMLMGELALTNLYNYAYTYDRIVAETLSGDYDAHTVRGNECNGLIINDSKTMFLHLLMFPLGKIKRGEYDQFDRLCRGDSSDSEFGRPKYLYDQIWGKVLFNAGNLGVLSYRQGDKSKPNESALTQFNINASQFRDLSLLRFHTTLVRKLVFLTLVHRFLRMKLQREVMFHDNIVLRDETLIDPHTTEYYNEQAFQSRYSHKYGEPSQLQFAPQSMEDQ